MKFGIVREGKIPADHRTPLTPVQCATIIQEFPQTQFYIQPSPHRAYQDSEYQALNLHLTNDLSDCNILLGVKEVPIHELIANKTYLFFSHTIKKQPYNQALMRAMVAKKITLIDYELLKDESGNRIVAFGYYAGIVGAYHALRGYGLKFGQYTLPPAHAVGDLKLLLNQKIAIRGGRFLLTGSGRVAKGAISVLENFGLKRVSIEEFLNQDFGDESVYLPLRSCDIYRRKDGKPFGEDFYQDPSPYESIFETYLQTANALVAAAYWNPKAPKLFSHPKNLKIIADITCDINGSIPTTTQASTIAEPYYDIDPKTLEIQPPFCGELTVMAIDNLPSELPRDASEGFGQMLCEKVVPEFFKPNSEVLRQATILQKGELMPDFEYLRDYASL